MTTKTEKAQTRTAQAKIEKTAAAYADLAKQIKTLEKAIKPLKEKLLNYAVENQLEETTDLGDVSIIYKEAYKASYDLNKAPEGVYHWLWEMAENGFGAAVDLTVNAKRVDPQAMAFDEAKFEALLGQIGYQAKYLPSFSIKVN